MWPPLPAAAATSRRLHHGTRWETERTRPAASRLVTSEDPPADTNGSGSPVVGRVAVATLKFRKACSAIVRVAPTPRSRPKRSGARLDTIRPRTVKSRKASTSSPAPRKAQLLADDREDEVGVRLGEVEQLLAARGEAHAGHSAAAERDERLAQLEAVAQRIAEGVEEGEDPGDPVFGGEHRPREQRGRDAPHHREMREPRSAHERSPPPR